MLTLKSYFLFGWNLILSGHPVLLFAKSSNSMLGILWVYESEIDFLETSSDLLLLGHLSKSRSWEDRWVGLNVSGSWEKCLDGVSFKKRKRKEGSLREKLNCLFLDMILLKIYWIRKIDAFSDEKKAPCKHNRSCEGDKALAVELNCIQIYSDKASMREDR